MLAAATASIDPIQFQAKESQHSERLRDAVKFLQTKLGSGRSSGLDEHSTDVEALMQLMKNGVLLCRLINTLKPGCIKRINLRNTPFADMENISNFLEQASHLGVISSDLFQTADLHDLRNPAQVITTILALARAVGCYSPTKRLLSPSSTENIQPITLNYESPASSSSKPHIFITNSDTPVAIISTPVPPPPSPTPLLVSSTPVSPLPKRREHRNETKKCLLPKSNSSPSKLIELSPSSASAAAVGTKERITVFEQSESGDDQQMVANYQLGTCIGKGQFGAVYKALDLQSGEVVAIKKIDLSEQDTKGVAALMKEIELLKSLRHPNIVQYLGFAHHEDYLNIILEYVENGSLLHLMRTFSILPETLAVKYVAQVLHGLAYLHEKDVAHCDLKAANILTTKIGDVKLSDFGVSIQLKEGRNSSTAAVVGTPNWMAPEIIELNGASTASDIWSLGCTIVEMVTGKPPYADLIPMTAMFKIVQEETPPIPEDVSVDLRDFLVKCFQKNPINRPTALDLLDHAWIKRHNTKSVHFKEMDSFFTDGVSSISLSGKLSDTSSNGNQQQFTDQTTASTTTTIATQRSKRAVSMSSNVLADGIAASRKSISSDFVRQEFRTGYYGGARFTGPSLDIPRSRFADLDMEEDEDDDGGDVVAPMGNGKVKFMSKVSSKASGGSGGETASSVWTKRLRNRIRMSCDVSTWEREKFVKPLSSGVIVVPPGGGARSTTTLSSSPAKTMSFSMKSLFLNHPRGMAAEESSVSSSSGLAKRTSTPVFSSSKKKFGSEVHGVYEDDGSSSSKKIHSKSGITAESGNCIVS